MLRFANLDDADLLLRFRNDETVRNVSRNTGVINKTEHLCWLQNFLRDDDNHLLIASIDDSVVGVLRALFNGCGYDLTWIVVPWARGNGIAKKMVSLWASKISDEIRAEVKEGNVASVKIAESVGMELVGKSNGFLQFRRRATNSD